MSQCQRCGATNDPTSRFCVACGAPLAVRPATANPSPLTMAPPPPQLPPGVGPQQPPAWNPQQVGFPPNAPMPSGQHRAPPSSGLGFAETASPPTDADFEAQRAAAQAAAAAMRKGSKPPQPRASEPPPQHFSGSVPAPQQYGGSAPPAQAPPPQYSSSSVPAQAPPPYSSSAPPPGSYAMAPPQMTAAMPSLDPEAVPEGAPRMLAGFIVSYDTHPLGRSWPIYQGRNRIGRQGSGADLDVELDHPTASSRHAVMLASACPGRIKIEDSGSTNGTLINGARLAPGSRHELKDGDRVRFGLLSAIIKIV